MKTKSTSHVPLQNLTTLADAGGMKKSVEKINERARPSNREGLELNRKMVPGRGQHFANNISEMFRHGLFEERYPGLLGAAKDDVEKAFLVTWTRFEGLQNADRCLRRVVFELEHKDFDCSPADLDSYQLRNFLRAHQEIETDLNDLTKTMAAVGESEALSDFPKAQLEALMEATKTNIASLQAEIDARPERQTRPAHQTRPVERSGFQRAYAAPDPSQVKHPETKAVLPKDVETFEKAAASLAQTLDQPGLVKQLETIHAHLEGDEQAAFAKHVGTYAMLAESSVNAPNYKLRGLHSRVLPRNRQGYRARHWKDNCRDESMIHGLQQGIQNVVAAKNKNATFEQAITTEFLHGIGVSKAESADWQVDVGAIRQALEGEAFIPLRAMNQIKRPYRGREEEVLLTQTAVKELTQAVAEGRYEKWRATHPASKVQLSKLDAQQQEKWNKGGSVEHEFEDGTKVTVRQATGFDLFWATKVAGLGGSHGFDSFMPNAILSITTNVRTSAALISDPRWPGDAARAYFRILPDGPEKNPVLMLDGHALDAGYPFQLQGEVEKAMVQFALERGKELGLKVAIDGRYFRTVQQLDVELDRKRLELHLDPSHVWEASDSFGGEHDWLQVDEQIIPLRQPAFIKEFD